MRSTKRRAFLRGSRLTSGSRARRRAASRSNSRGAGSAYLRAAGQSGHGLSQPAASADGSAGPTRWRTCVHSTPSIPPTSDSRGIRSVDGPSSPRRRPRNGTVRWCSKIRSALGVFRRAGRRTLTFPRNLAVVVQARFDEFSALMWDVPPACMSAIPAKLQRSRLARSRSCPGNYTPLDENSAAHLYVPQFDTALAIICPPPRSARALECSPRRCTAARHDPRTIRSGSGRNSRR